MAKRKESTDMVLRAQTEVTTDGRHRKLYCIFQPIVLVIDDEPDPLLRSIQSWLEEQYDFKPRFDVLHEASNFKQIEERLHESDFVLLDHRLNNKFSGFSSGAQIGLSIKALRQDLPI